MVVTKTGTDPSAEYNSVPPTTHSRIRAKTIGVDFAAPKEKKPRTLRGTEKKRREKDAREARDRRIGNEWKNARPGHLVALYAACHDKVYGFAPAELENAREYAMACLAASRMLRTIFDSDSEMMVDFMRWSWKREESREKWRRDNNMSGQRLGWRLQFAPHLLSDYRLDMARKKGA